MNNQTKADSPLTAQEELVMMLIVNAQNAFMVLEPTHPSEQGQWIDAIHNLQTVLLQRNLRRQYPDYFTSTKQN